MKLFRVLICSVVFLVTTLVVVVGSMVAATAEDACTGPVYWKANYWNKTQSTGVLTWDPLGPVIEFQKWNHMGIMRYWWCPRGAQTDLVQFESFVYCAEKADNNEAANMRGFGWDTYISNDNNRVTDPGSASGSWPLGAGNIGNQHCWGQDFSNSPWLWRTTHPYWKLTLWVNLWLQPDDEVSDGSVKHYLNYGDDPNVVLF